MAPVSSEVSASSITDSASLIIYVDSKSKSRQNSSVIFTVHTTKTFINVIKISQNITRITISPITCWQVCHVLKVNEPKFGPFSKIFGYLGQSSDIFGKVRKIFGNISFNFWTTEKSSKSSFRNVQIDISLVRCAHLWALELKTRR